LQRNIVANNRRRRSNTLVRACDRLLPQSSIGSIRRGKTGQWRRIAFGALVAVRGDGLQAAIGLGSFDAAADESVEVYGVVGVAVSVHVAGGVDYVAGAADGAIVRGVLAGVSTHVQIVFKVDGVLDAPVCND
jgi:hypothetical protein